MLYISGTVDYIIKILIMICRGVFLYFFLKKCSIVNFKVILFFISPLQQSFVFLKFINKCQKEILMCVPPSLQCLTFQICIDLIVQDDIFLRVIFLLCSNLFREMFYKLHCFALAGLKCFCASLICFLPNTNGNKFNMELQINYLQKDNWAHLLKCWCVINLSYKALHMQQ